mmetsp:Transcript_56884/g.117560  ORF Transcript_56884/g.117560 Transcript_56884/m.117560 type:complete len:233 (+) Transcript_56884:3-701(+)
MMGLCTPDACTLAIRSSGDIWLFVLEDPHLQAENHPSVILCVRVHVYPAIFTTQINPVLLVGIQAICGAHIDPILDFDGCTFVNQTAIAHLCAEALFLGSTRVLHQHPAISSRHRLYLYRFAHIALGTGLMYWSSFARLRLLRMMDLRLHWILAKETALRERGKCHIASGQQTDDCTLAGLTLCFCPCAFIQRAAILDACFAFRRTGGCIGKYSTCCEDCKHAHHLPGEEAP